MAELDLLADLMVNKPHGQMHGGRWISPLRYCGSLKSSH